MCGSDYEVYNLFLDSSTCSFIINDSAVNDITYQINWDALFRGNNFKYKKCRVRAQLITSKMTEYSVQFTTGFLVMRGPTSNYSYGSGVIDGGVYLLTLNPSPSSNSGDIVAGYYYNCSTLDNIRGTQLSMPSGIQNIHIQFLNEDGSFIPNSYVPPLYGLMLQFELSSRIE